MLQMEMMIVVTILMKIRIIVHSIHVHQMSSDVTTDDASLNLGNVVSITEDFLIFERGII